MRPTIDEQLGGAVRLLRIAENDPETPPGVAELARNARRLVDRVATSWTTALPFLQDDNSRLASLLGIAEPATTNNIEVVSEANEMLRAALTRRIRMLPAGPDRAAIGNYLRDRLAADPT